MKVFHPVDFLYQIAVVSLQKAEDLDSCDKKDSKEWGNKQEFEMKSARVTAVAFSALCLEAIVNHLLASYEKRIPKTKKAQKHKGRTFLELAWFELPALFEADKRFDEDKPPFKVFKELMDVRNNTLFHNRPKQKTTDGLPYLDDLAEDASHARKYVRCIVDMLQELNRLTPGKKVLIHGRTIQQFLSEQPHLYWVSSS